MEIKVKSLYLKSSPRKVRPVLHGLRGLSADQAKKTLMFTNKKGAEFLVDLVKSGIAAAKENYLEADKVVIKSIFCGDGPRLKRIQPWSKGQARRIVKRMCHLTLVLESIDAEKSKSKTQISNKSEEPISKKPEVMIKEKKTKSKSK